MGLFNFDRAKGETEQVIASEFSKEAEVILSPTKQMINKFKANRLSMTGFGIFLSIILIVIIAHFYVVFSNYDLAHTDASLKYLPPRIKYVEKLGIFDGITVESINKDLLADEENFPVGSYEILSETTYRGKTIAEVELNNYKARGVPDKYYIFGTDQFGRDFFIRVIEGGWISIQVGFVSTLMSIVIGVTMGAIAGFFSGIVDSIIMRTIEIVSSFPFLAIAITVATITAERPAKERLFYIIILLGLITWTGLARMVRGQILSLREQEFIVATKALGIKRRNQIMRHLIPNVLAFVVVSGTLTFAQSILGEASLSYLNLSVQEPIPTWGRLLSQAAVDSTILRTAWWTWIFPGTLLFLFIMGINLIGEGLRDAIDPKSEFVSKERRKALRKERKAEKRAKKEMSKGVSVNG